MTGAIRGDAARRTSMPGDLLYAGAARMIVVGRSRGGAVLGLSFGAGSPGGGNDALIKWYPQFGDDVLFHRVSGRPSQEPSRE